MAITFRVDDVVPAPQLPATHTLQEHLGDVLAFGGDGGKRVLKTTAGCPHPLLGAIHVAFAEHRPLVLSPDAVWLTILGGVAQHVKLNAEALRPRLVRHQGKRVLKVKLSKSLEQNPAAIREAVAAFRALLAEEIGDGRARLLTCDFSTTGDVERTASEILLMDTLSSYFDYQILCVCGIPEITLLGVPADWRAMRDRVDVLAELDLAWWTSSLAPILDQFVRASEGQPDAAFFRDIYKPQDAYGSDIIAGWSARFYPYLAAGGRFDRRNPLLEVPLGFRPAKRKDSLWYAGPGIRAKDVMGGVGSAIVRVEDAVTQRRYTLDVQGGMVGVEVDEQGRLAPCAGWTVRYAEASIGQVIEALRVRPDFVAGPPEPPPPVTMDLSTSEQVALADAFGEARLFVGGNEWRLRSPSQAQFIDLTIPGRRHPTSICRRIDLPDGSFVGYASITSRRPWLLRLRASELEPLPEPPPIDPVTGLSTKDRVRHPGETTHQTRQAADDIEFLGESLTELLDRALATDGAPPAAVSSLAARLAAK